MSLTEKVTAVFQARFGEAPAHVVQAPGRVNLIGEHTDYNDGFVLPMAIDRGTWIALRPREDNTVSVYSLEMEETAEFALSGLTHQNQGWKEYLKGVTWALQEEGYALNGWEGVMSGNVPIGSGLSSSAALELATAKAFHVVSDFAWEPSKMALLSQKTENRWMGVNSGIMDQMISASGAEGKALLIDCRSLAHQLVPLPPAVDGAETAVVVLDTATRRGLVDSAYNERREQCEAAARYFGVDALRDVSLTEFLASGDGLDELTHRRAKHVISENIRTLNAGKAMENADAQLLGQLMNDSHSSLRDDFEVSSMELDIMAEIAQAQDGCFGARMTGAGFGGCAVALVHEDFVDGFVTAVSQAYQAQTNLEPKIYVCKPSAGAGEVEIGS